MAARIEQVRVERDGPVTTVVMSRPETRNAVDGPAARELAAAFRAFDADEGASVAVLWGEGGTFCSGADLTSIGTGRSPRVDPPPADGPLGCTRMRLSKPVIAAVAGHAVAGGLELALWCDLRVVEETATFGVYCRRWGVPLVDGGTFRLPRLIGTSRAMDLILTGRPVPAREAFEIGLANRLVPPGRRGRRPRPSRPSWRGSRRRACATTAPRSWRPRASRRPRRSPSSTGTGPGRWRTPCAAPPGSRAGTGGTATSPTSDPRRSLTVQLPGP